MDRASILQDAIDYLKELRQKISELERGLELLPPAATPPVATGFSQLIPNASAIPSCSKKDLVQVREPARVSFVLFTYLESSFSEQLRSFSFVRFYT